MRVARPPNVFVALALLCLTSSQRILAKGRIAGACFFHGGQCNVTPTSREHCSRLQQSCYHAVIEDWMIHFAYTKQQMLPMLFNGLNNPKHCPFASGESRPHLIHGSWTHVSQPPNGISIGSAVFAQHIRVTNTQTDRPRYLRHL